MDTLTVEPSQKEFVLEGTAKLTENGGLLCDEQSSVDGSLQFSSSVEFLEDRDGLLSVDH